MTIGVAICIFGDVDRWRPFAERARRSVLNQTQRPDELLVHVGVDLASARNDAASALSTEQIVFLDADDWLDQRFIEKVATVDGDLVQVATRYHSNGVARTPPHLLQRRNLLDGNFLIIGTRARRQMILDVGGFRDMPAYEDWDLWIRCWLAGARISACKGAVYNVNVNPAGRNMRTPAGSIKQLRETYLGEALRKGMYP